MARSDCTRVNRQPPNLVSIKVRIAAFLAYLLAGMGNMWAAPVTLQFEATVGPPRQGALGPLPPSWNTSLQQGDTITGAFSFEPFDAASGTSHMTIAQQFDFTIQIKSNALVTAQYGIEVYNDHTSDDSPVPTDNINMGCSFLGGGTVCAPTSISPSALTEWAFGIAMFGGSTLLDGADIPRDPNVWQQFAFYDMDVSFFDGHTGLYYGFQATPRTFREVPEVKAHFLPATGIVLMMMFVRRVRNINKFAPNGVIHVFPQAS